MLSQNPLIHENPHDTIDCLEATVEWLYTVASDSDDIPKGFTLSLNGVLLAVKSLQNKNLKEAGAT